MVLINLQKGDRNQHFVFVCVYNINIYIYIHNSKNVGNLCKM